jgi:hypothetical protein
MPEHSTYIKVSPPVSNIHSIWQVCTQLYSYIFSVMTVVPVTQFI